MWDGLLKVVVALLSSPSGETTAVAVVVGVAPGTVVVSVIVVPAVPENTYA